MSIKLAGLQHLLREITGYEGHLAGGCVRDTLQGINPKDYDFVITQLANETDSCVFGCMSDISESVSELSLGRSEIFQAYGEGDCNSDFTQMFKGCMKLTLTHTCSATNEQHTFNVDVLFSNYPTIEEHIEQHDCNANMVYLNDAGEIVGSKVDELIFLAGICPERIRYMTEKWSNMRAGI